MGLLGIEGGVLVQYSSINMKKDRSGHKWAPQEEPHEDASADWGVASTSQRMPKMANNQKPGERPRADYFSWLQKELALQTP